MHLATLTAQLEALEAALNLEYYEQYAGMGGSEAAGAAGRRRGKGGDEKEMDALAARQQALATDALRTSSRADLPPLLWQSLVAGRAASDLTRYQNETYRLRNDEVAVDAGGERVTLNSVRLFNHKHVDDAPLRKRVFDGLLERASALTPTLEARFRLSAKVWAEHGMTPLDVYCVEERLTKERLVQVVDSAARAAKPHFEREAEAFSEEVLGKPFEYYDDMYVFRHSVFGPVDPELADVDFRAALAKLATTMGFPVGKVLIDGEARPGKFASPVCFGVEVPGDVRVLYQRTSPVGDYESFYHEMGHALHFISVEPGRSYEDRRLIPNGVAEIFSTLIEEVAMDPVYLREDLGLADDVVEDLLRRRRFMELFFLTFYGANSMHKVRFWEERLHADFERADDAYADLTERYMGVRVPGIYWQTHHILSMSDMYAPSYLLAHIRKAELIRELEKRFGRAWWRAPGAGEHLRTHAMGPGAAIDLDAFSKLDVDAYLQPLLRGGR